MDLVDLPSKILIVEDTSLSAVLMEYLLAPLGSCMIVDDGEEAEKVIQDAIDVDEPFGLICLDVQLPGICGPELLTALRGMEIEADLSEDQKATVIVSSVSPQHEVRGLNSEDYQTYLQKPFTKENVVTCLSSTFKII